eukprot:5041509-Amphidinium_carterae.2
MGYSPPSLHPLHQLSVVTSWLDLDERVMQAENMTIAWESVAELSDVPTLNSSFDATSACSGDSISSSELRQRILPEGAQRARTLCPPGVDSDSDAPHVHDRGAPPQPQPCCEAEHSDPDDYLSLTELANHPGTPPHLLVDPEYEVAPTQLDAVHDTLHMSDSDNATLDYNQGPLAQQGMARLQACALPTRSTDDDPISQFSSDEATQAASLLQCRFPISPRSVPRRARVSWRLWWEQFAPQLTLLCSALAWLHRDS